MSEPLSTGATTTAVTGVAFISWLSGLDAGAVIGAFAGSAVFIATAPDFSIKKKFVLFVASLIAGILCAGFVAGIVTAISPDGVDADREIGALIASAVAVRLLMFLGKQAGDPLSTFERFKRGPHG